MTNDDAKQLDDAPTASAEVLCPHCSERFSRERPARCPVCFGDLRADDALREHAWRHHDDRVDMAEFERWLGGHFEVAGLDKSAVAPRPDSPSTAGVAAQGPMIPPAIDAPQIDRVAAAAEASVDAPAETSERDDDWPPQFSPGLRINFRAQPFESVRGEHEADGGEGAENSHRREARTEPPRRAETAHGKSPVLIIEGPGPVIFGGRPTRSIIVSADELSLGRSSRDGRRRVDVDLGAYTEYDRLIARRHARIYFDRGLWFIEDFADNDATFLYGRAGPLNLEAVPLRAGDRILIGDSVRIRFHTR